MTCPHATSSWRGIVTNALDPPHTGAHMSISTCARGVCIDKCKARVLRYTKQPAEFYLYATIRAEKYGNA